MRILNFRNLSMIAAVASCLIQAGAQLFAVVVVVGTVTEAPPRSLAMYAGDFGYDSARFWTVAPMVTAVLLLFALGANWKTPRRRLLLCAVAAFVIAGLFTALVTEPVQTKVVSAGYSDTVDAGLRSLAARWQTLDLLSCGLALVVGILTTFALAIPLSDRDEARNISRAV